MRLRLLPVLALLLLAASTATLAGAVAPPTMPLNQLGYLAVDDANGHVFVTGYPCAGLGTGNVAVMNTDGTAATTITGETGASGLAVSGGKLYVARCGTTSIDVFDTSTLAKTETITTSRAIGFPADLHVVDGRIWVDLVPAAGGDAKAAGITVAAPHTQEDLATAGKPLFFSDPAHPHRLVTAREGGSTTEYWDIGQSPAVQTGYSPSGGADLGFNALTPDGTHLLDQGGPGIRGLLLPTLIWDQSYDTGIYGAGPVATSANGYLAVSANDGPHRGVMFFAPGEFTPQRVEIYDGSDIAARLAFSADGQTLYVATLPATTGSPSFRVISDAELPGSALTLTAAPHDLIPGQSAQLDGTFSFGDGASPVGKTVDVTVTRPDGTTGTVGSVVTGAGGAYNIGTGELGAEGTYTFTASYAGDAGHAATANRTTVVVTRIPEALTLHTSVTSLVFGHTVTVSVSVAPAVPGGVVNVYRSAAGVKTLAGAVTLDGSGAGSLTLKPGQNTVYSAEFVGDATHAPDAAPTVAVKVLPVLGGTISRGYGMSGAYHLYHYQARCASSGAACPIFAAHAAPNMASNHITLVLQQKVRTGWKSIASWQKTLGAKSTTTFTMRYLRTSVIGKSTRVALVFGGNPAHGAVTWGFWYFRVTR